MRSVKGADTAPEWLVRRMVFGMGYRYRLHGQNLPGKPDLVFSVRRKVIFVHGCFWHGHECARGARVPSMNRDYWITKVARNRARDDRVLRELKELGWRNLVIWECETRDERALRKRLKNFLGQVGGRRLA